MRTHGPMGDARTEMVVKVVQDLKSNLRELFDGELEARKNVAAKCHISQSSITRWLRNDNLYIPEIYYLKVIAEHFGVSIDSLVFNRIGEGSSVSYQKTDDGIKIKVFIPNEGTDDCGGIDA